MTDKDTVPPAYFENERWACEHSTDLHKQYEGRWVAIANQQVVAVGPSARVRELAARRIGRPTAEVFVRFVDSPFTIYGTGRTLL
jgi:hypothetical protein